MHNKIDQSSQLGKLKFNLFVQLSLLGLIPLITLILVILKVGQLGDGIYTATTIESLARSERMHYKAFVDGVIEAVDLDYLSDNSLKELEKAESDLRQLQAKTNDISELDGLYNNLHEQLIALQGDKSIAQLVRLRPSINSANSALEKITRHLEEVSDQQIHLLINITQKLEYVLFALAGAMLFLLIFVVRYIIRRLTLPLEKAIALCTGIANGNLSSEGKLIVGSEDIGGLVSNIDRMRCKWADVIFQLTHHIKMMRLSAHNLSLQVAELEENSQLQSKSANAIETSIEEMSTSMDKIADRAHEATSHANQGGMVAFSGVQAIELLETEIDQVSALIDKVAINVNDLDAKAAGIGVVVTVISELADQTNLLALNAAIEAARAGDAGRGFAVVAEEVRKLADKTETSTKSITDMISEMKLAINQIVLSMNSSVKVVKHSVELSREVTHQMTEVQTMSKGISTAIDIVDHSLREQRSSAEQIEHKIMSIVTSAENHATSGKKVLESAQSIETTAEAIANHIVFFKIDDPASHTHNAILNN